jgi:hypothetical protein
LEFSEFIKNNFPDYTKNCRIVEEKDSCISEVAYINDFRDVLAIEQQSNMVQEGLLISDKIDDLKKETTKNFKDMDTKYDLISEGMFLLANKIDERMQKLEERWETANTRTDERNKIVDDRMEKTEKSIEELLKILANK